MVGGAAGVSHGIDDGRSGLEPACVAVGEAKVLFGTTSWADRSLVQSGSFYPKKTMSARERLWYYATRFPLAEIATTYRFPPTPDLSRQWVERTPDGFTFDLRAWSLLTGAPTMPDSLWPDLQDQVKDTSRDQRRLYPGHLTPQAYEECWDRFAHSIRPLSDAGRLGVVILQYPSWFSPRPEAWAELALARHRLEGVRLAVEFRSPKWLDGDACEPTLEWLEEHGLGFVCVDGPPAGPRAFPSVSAVTSDVAVVRFVGRRHVDDEPWTWPYRYGAGELSEWVPRLTDLASSAPEVHVLMDNPWRTDAVDNAAALAALLSADQRSG
jgi:uncharacterized protein YecE (DUF72 family)